ncbi:MerC domain-containing protein [Chitinophaga vietnamensis]|nr:MerC domain-containing protein [Chitinophaga vietnamensis]
MRVRLPGRMNLDALGIGASLLCAIHCALLPLLMTVLPLLGAAIFENATVEYALLGASFLIGCLALGRGYWRTHRRLLPLLLFAGGFSLLVFGHFMHAGNWIPPVIITVGAVAIITAHLLNLRHCRPGVPHNHS